MSGTLGFIETPTQTLTFKARVQASVRTVAAFMQDQKWVSLLVLVVYLALMFWDFHNAKLITPEPDHEAWLQKLPEFLQGIFRDSTPVAQGSWQGSLAGLLALVYWINALLYIANRSEAFRDDEVVGFVRYILRGFGILLIMVIPIALGFALLIVPGLVLTAATLAATHLAAFREQTIFGAIQSGFRLTVQGLPGQSRFLGFSRTFFAIIGAYGLTMALAWGLTGIYQLLAPRVWPDHVIAHQYIRAVALDHLFSAFLQLVFSVFILHLFAERIRLMSAAEKEST